MRHWPQISNIEHQLPAIAVRLPVRVSPRGHASQLDSIFNDAVDFSISEILRFSPAPWDRDSILFEFCRCHRYHDKLRSDLRRVLARPVGSLEWHLKDSSGYDHDGESQNSVTSEPQLFRTRKAGWKRGSRAVSSGLPRWSPLLPTREMKKKHFPAFHACILNALGSPSYDQGAA